ncbi:hypothetical protein GLAREA_11738 [Glarea lozoyensis ATCC 20868]|uniref:Phosphoribosylaminoimidazole-succinocarboxamide synthase n=1 Tax=Glarea lozoyensis (strain ATCC 20868 / MF5171) TaxID=1116229 RepID=S3CF78_GLAL2|nr:uncharacterized protein GLAREA_11738 [Glarea lozoyensis ATCC 20868]EPE25157.1 hypothetical protein GLAREA_11738 [Glarea lozoyensis ATCC 20868]
MNLGDIDVQRVHHERPQLQRVSTSELPPLPALAHIDHCSSLTSSISEALTVIPWHGRQQTSQQNSPQGSPQSFSTVRPDTRRDSVGLNEAAHASNTPLVVRFDEEQIRNDELAAAEREREETMDRTRPESGPPTPVDDTPYIRFAIDQLTIKEDIAFARRPLSEASSDYPVNRVVPDLGLGYLSTQRQREELALTRKHRSTPTPEGRLFNYNATRPLSEHSSPSPIPRRQNLSVSPEIFIPVDAPSHTPRYPTLTYVPITLRPLSILALSFFCVLMIAAIIFCAIFSSYHQGLFEWTGGIHGGRYFTFGYLPQILAAILMLYVQAMMAASTRVLPYTMLAMNDAYMRADALFLGIFPRTMLWPHWSGPLSIRIANLFQWMIVFTIPLQSCLFSVIPLLEQDGTQATNRIGDDEIRIWRWTAVQGVAWTLVALYIFVLVGTVIRGLFFFRRVTGLMWDPRSLADIISLLPRSNCLDDYAGTDAMGSKQELRARLELRSDRLGYWMTQHRSQGLFYCIGEEGSSTRRYTLESGKISEKKVGGPAGSSIDLEKSANGLDAATRFRSITWYLRDTYVVLWAIAAFLITLAIIIVSFLPSTSISKGFQPLQPAATDRHGWSSANFVYSFVPSLLGMLLYLFMQSIDMSIRKLQPYADLGNTNGATAGTSLLVDYTAALPLECTISALSGGHFRVALLSLFSFLALLLPVLAGGLFFALTSPSTNEARMYPNMPAFYICIVLLAFYVMALLSLLPRRTLMHLPHDVDCLAEIFSFLYASRMLEDASFRAPRSKADLVTRLMITQDNGGHALYGFGLYRGRNGKECLGIDKLGRPGPAGVSIFHER